MLFISKGIRDPSARFASTTGLTIGLTFHTTKRWKCSEANLYTNQFYEMRYPEPVSSEELERNVQYKLWHDRNCSKRTRHVSYPGYMYWTGPKNRYTFRFAGPTHPREKWWKPFSKESHGRYVRWMDNGPQNPPASSREKLHSALNNPAWRAHRENFRAAMESYRVQCEEYERVRSAHGRGTYKP